MARKSDKKLVAFSLLQIRRRRPRRRCLCATMRINNNRHRHSQRQRQIQKVVPTLWVPQVLTIPIKQRQKLGRPVGKSLPRVVRIINPMVFKTTLCVKTD